MFNLNRLFKFNEPSLAEKQEVLLEAIKPSERPVAKKLRRSLMHPEKYKTLSEYHRDLNSFSKIVGKAYKSIESSKSLSPKYKQAFATDYPYSYMTGSRKQPFGSTLVEDFPSEMEMYIWLYRNHPVVYRCLEIIREELANDGYVLKHYKGTSKRDLRKTHELLKDLGIDTLRLNIAAHLKLFGNAWLMKTKDKESKKDTLKLLAPEKIKPIENQETGEIVGWRYQKGRAWEDYTTDKIYHLYLFNAETEREFGEPPLQASLNDIQVDLGIKVYQRQAMDKGFLGSVVFSLEAPAEKSWDEDEDEDVESVQDYIRSAVSGATAGGEAMAMIGLKEAVNLKSDPMPGSFSDTTKDKSKIICMCLGVPSEKISISRSESIQYVPSFIEYSVNASFDKSLTYLTGLVDDFLNKVFLKKMYEIYDIRIEAGGRFGSLTKTAAEVIKLLAEAGPIITVNQALELILGWEGLPPENPRGNYVLDNTKGRTEGLKTSEVPRYPGIVDPEKEDYELSSPQRGAKKITWDTFAKIVEDIREEKNIKSGKYEKRDLTHAAEDAIVTYVSVRPGKLRFFYEGSTYN